MISLVLLIHVLHGVDLSADAPGVATPGVATPVDTPAETPRYLWKYLTGGKIVQKAAVGHDGVVYFGSHDRWLYALYPSGDLKWKYRFKNRPVTSPIIGYDGSIYIGVWSGKLHALAPNGKIRWSFQTVGEDFAGTPVLGSDGTIFVPCKGGYLQALTYAGKEKWRLRLQSEISDSPAVGLNDRVYVGTDDRRLLVIDASGDIVWEVPLSGIPGSPAIDNQGNIHICAHGVHVFSSLGHVKWEYLLPYSGANPVITSNGTTIFGTANGILYALDATGEKVWELDLGSPIKHAPVIGYNGMIFVPAQLGLFAVSAAGALRWRMDVTREYGVPAFTERGTVYIGSADWMLYAIEGTLGAKGGQQESVRGAWPTYLHDSQNMGRLTGLRDLENATYFVLREKLLSGVLEIQASALKEIEDYLQRKQFIPLHASLAEQFLAQVISEGVTHRTLRGHGMVTYPKQMKIWAYALLAELATENAKSILLSAIRYEADISVRAYAVEALGKIGNDSDGTAVAILDRQITTETMDERYVLAVVEALQRILLFTSPHDQQTAVKTLVKIAYGNFPSIVEEEARAVLAMFQEDMQKVGKEKAYE